MTTIVNLQWGIGEDHTIDFTATDENDAALDLTSAEIEWAIDDSVVATVTNGKAVILDAVNGVARINLPGADTSSLTLGWQQHWCRVTMADGSKSIQFRGDINIYEKPDGAAA